MNDKTFFQEYEYRKSFIEAFLSCIVQGLRKLSKRQYTIYCDEDQIQAVQRFIGLNNKKEDVERLKQLLFDINMITMLFGVSNALLDFRINHTPIPNDDLERCTNRYEDKKSFVKAKIDLFSFFQTFVTVTDNGDEPIKNHICFTESELEEEDIDVFNIDFYFGFHSIYFYNTFKLDQKIIEFYNQHRHMFLEDIVVSLNILLWRACMDETSIYALCRKSSYDSGFQLNEDKETININELEFETIAEYIDGIMEEFTETMRDLLLFGGQSPFGKFLSDFHEEYKDSDEESFGKRIFDLLADLDNGVVPGNVATIGENEEMKINLITGKKDTEMNARDYYINEIKNKTISNETDANIQEENSSKETTKSDLDNIAEMISDASKLVVDQMNMNVADYKKIYKGISAFLSKYQDIHSGKVNYKEIGMGGLPDNIRNVIVMCFDKKNTAAFGIEEDSYEVVNLSNYANMFKMKIEYVAEEIKEYPRIITISENMIRNHGLTHFVNDILNVKKSNPLVFYKDCLSLIGFGFLTSYIRYTNSKTGDLITTIDNPSFSTTLHAFEKSSMFQDTSDIDQMISILSSNLDWNKIPYFRGTIPPECTHVTFPNGNGIIYAFNTLFQKRNTNVSCFLNDAQFIAACNGYEIHIPKSDYIFKSTFNEDIVKILNYIKISKEVESKETKKKRK